ncbi:uncharacterized protein, partial [Phyllobates terribilis]|uniref:uncharacterized protein n=1 Tax=Phyllobates terribilis TaxID=111132 RepID=UPI003CCAA9BE
NVVVEAIVPIAIIGILILIGVLIWMIKINKIPNWSFTLKKKSHEGEKYPEATDCLNFDFHAIETATKGFSLSNKLGEGGFGIVYEGVLENGDRVAVKRLSQKSVHGSEEFQTEMVVVAKLQHKNLVRLIGFCDKGDERLLVYEYLPNLSLDLILFDPTRSSSLTWIIRLKIISGIARGLQYLHEDSRVTIIHRDLKTSNILLDNELEPKIADFGMARLVNLDQSSDITSRVVGTYGYMAPEYVSMGRISVKSDVYSFGVLILEILSGQSNTRFYKMSRGEGLMRRLSRDVRIGFLYCKLKE